MYPLPSHDYHSFRLLMDPMAPHPTTDIYMCPLIPHPSTPPLPPFDKVTSFSSPSHPSSPTLQLPHPPTPSLDCAPRPLTSQTPYRPSRPICLRLRPLPPDTVRRRPPSTHHLTLVPIYQGHSSEHPQPICTPSSSHLSRLLPPPRILPLPTHIPITSCDRRPLRPLPMYPQSRRRTVILPCELTPA